MLLYHLSDSLKVGDVLQGDHQNTASLVTPFLKALRVNIELYYSLLLQADYVGEVLARYQLKGMVTNEIKWACEGLFEWVRQNEFPQKSSRLSSIYYFDSLENCRKLYTDYWKSEKEKIKLFEVEVDGPVDSYDMCLYDRAFSLLNDLESPERIDELIDLARLYYQGYFDMESVKELLSEGRAVVKRDLSGI